VKYELAEPQGSLSEEQRLLVMQYLPMADAVVQASCRSKPLIERDELQATAYMALVEAARSFDPTRNVNFATYARFHMTGALQDCERFQFAAGWRGDDRVRPNFQQLGRHAELYGTVIGKQPELPAGALTESIEAVEEWLTRLPIIQAWACRLLYVYGFSVADAAEHLGYSKSYFSRLHKDALAELVKAHKEARELSQADSARPVE
jgi:RNA polymerase sigma factor (sigma-70 family)